MARAVGARSQLAFAFESVYGTPPGSGFRRLPFVRSDAGASQPLIESDILGRGRDPLDPTRDAIAVDGDLVVPICARSWGYWLRAAFGDASTTDDAGVYTHVFESGKWSLPSFAIEIAKPEVPSYAMLTGCKLDRLSWTMQRGGQLTASLSIVGQDETLTTTSGAGSPADVALQRFGQFNGAIMRDGSALANVVSAELTYANNLDRIETIRGDGLIEGADPSMAMLSGRMDVRFATTQLLDQAIAGDPCELEFAFALAGGESCTLTAHRVFLPRPRRQIEGPQGVQVSFDWQAALDESEGVMCTATLVNDVEEY